MCRVCVVHYGNLYSCLCYLGGSMNENIKYFIVGALLIIVLFLGGYWAGIQATRGLSLDLTNRLAELDELITHAQNDVTRFENEVGRVGDIYQELANLFVLYRATVASTTRVTEQLAYNQRRLEFAFEPIENIIRRVESGYTEPDQ